MRPRFTSSTTSGNGATSRSFEDVDFGTTLEVLIESRNAGLSLELKYSVSTMLDSQDPDVPEQIDTTSVQTRLSVRPGEPQICAILKADETTIITVRLER